jgi:hypothetical protein
VRTVAVGCLDPDHGHRFVVRRRSLDRDAGLITLWVCPVTRSVGVIWEDNSRDPATLTPGGPLP